MNTIHSSPQSQGKDRKARDYKKDVDQIHEELERQAKGLPRVPANDTTVQEVDSEELPGEADDRALLPFACKLIVIA